MHRIRRILFLQTTLAGAVQPIRVVDDLSTPATVKYVCMIVFSFFRSFIHAMLYHRMIIATKCCTQSEYDHAESVCVRIISSARATEWSTHGYPLVCLITREIMKGGVAAWRGGVTATVSVTKRHLPCIRSTKSIRIFLQSRNASA